MHYPCSENKGADQLRGYREADLRLCFRICKKPVFSRRGSHDLGTYGVCGQFSGNSTTHLNVRYDADRIVGMSIKTSKSVDLAKIRTLDIISSFCVCFSVCFTRRLVVNCVD